MKKYQVFLLIALMLVTVFVFYPVLTADFVNLDDIAMVQENWKIRSLSAENLKSLLFESHYKLYHPLVNLSYALEYRFFGMIPYYYHADNLILHLLSTLFVFFIFFRLTKSNFAVSLLTALLFACHPMHVEPVAWVTGRKDTLYAFFFLASWLMYLKAYSYKGGKYVFMMAISLILFLCSCLSKSMAVTLPAVLILSDWLTGRKIDRKSVLKYLPFILAAVAFALSTYLLYYSTGQKSNLTLYTLFVNFVSAHFNVLFYMVKFLIPVKLSVIYPYFFDANLTPPDYILYSPALLYGLMVLIICSLKKTKSIFFGFALFMITVFPVINILPTGVSPVADRYTYIPFIGFSYILAVAIMYIYRVINKTYIKASFAAIVYVLMILMCFTAQTKAEKWHDSKMLFEDIINNYPGAVSKAYSNRSHYHSEENTMKKREIDLETALFLDSNNNEATLSLAIMKVEQNEYNAAILLFKQLSFNDYNIDSVYMYLSKIYYEKKDKDKAYLLIKEAIERFPRTYFFYDTLGVFYAYDKEYEKAIETFQKSKQLNPSNAETYKYLAQIYDILGKYTLVEKEYMEGIENCLQNRILLHSLGAFYFDQNDIGNASVAFIQAVKKYPEDYQSYTYLGDIEYKGKNYKKSLYYYTLAVLIKNDFALAYFHRAAVHLEMNNYLKSAEDAKKAMDLGYTLSSAYLYDLQEKSGIVL